MTASTRDDTLLRRLVSRMKPYIEDGRVSSSRVDRVVASLRLGDHASEIGSRLREGLERSGVEIVDDKPAAVEPEDSEAQPIAALEVDESEPSGLVLDLDVTALDLDAAIQAARRRLALDSRTLADSRTLLTAEEEVGLAALMRAGTYQLSDDLPEDFRTSLPDSAEPARAFDSLVLHNYKLAGSVAQKYIGLSPSLTADDVVAFGVLGLIRGVRKFDASKGFKFSTYATWWIRQHITRALADCGRMIRLPVHMVEQVNKTRGAVAKLHNAGVAATPERLASVTGLSADTVRQHLHLMRDTTSLDLEFGDGTSLGALLQAPHDGSDLTGTELRALRRDIDAVLQTLSEREAGVMKLRSGMVSDTPKTLDEIGQIYGVTRERIRQIERKALDKLRQPESSARLLEWHQ